MDKFVKRELKISFYLANAMKLKSAVIEIIDGEGEVVTFVKPDGETAVFNPFSSKQSFFDAFHWALDQQININCYKHNLVAKNKAGQTCRRVFQPTIDARNTQIMEAIAILSGFVVTE